MYEVDNPCASGRTGYEVQSMPVIPYGNLTLDAVVVNFSFGIGSFCAAKRMCQEFGPKNVTLVFADVKSEDEDTYAWGRAAAKYLGAQLLEIAEGRTPWQVFEDENFIGNSRVDMCSRILKRQFIDKEMKYMYNQRRTLRVFGIHWSEYDRFFRIDKKTGKHLGIYPRMVENGWTRVRAPMCERPLIGYDEMEQWVKDAGLWQQKLYRLGFPHANCGGECVKQGQGGWALLYRTMPERFIKRRDWEETMRKRLGDVSILKERRNGKIFTLPLAELQRRIDNGEKCGRDMGGCSCFAGDELEDTK